MNDISFHSMCHICAILNGIAGIIVFSAPSALSAAWFPPNERTTATAVAIAFNNLGNAFSFLLGPAIVPDPSHKKNATEAGLIHSNLVDYSQIDGLDNGTSCPVIDPAENDLIISRISILMYVGKYT